MRGNKKGAAEFEAHSCLTTGNKHDTCLKKKRESREKHEAVSCAVGKPQHRGIMGNHRRKFQEADPIIRETRAAVIVAHIHIPHILRALHMNSNNNNNNSM